MSKFEISREFRGELYSIGEVLRQVKEKGLFANKDEPKDPRHSMVTIPHNRIGHVYGLPDRGMVFRANGYLSDMLNSVEGFLNPKGEKTQENFDRAKKELDNLSIYRSYYYYNVDNKLEEIRGVFTKFQTALDGEQEVFNGKVMVAPGTAASVKPAPFYQAPAALSPDDSLDPFAVDSVKMNQELWGSIDEMRKDIDRLSIGLIEQWGNIHKSNAPEIGSIAELERVLGCIPKENKFRDESAASQSLKSLEKALVAVRDDFDKAREDRGPQGRQGSPEEVFVKDLLSAVQKELVPLGERPASEVSAPAGLLATIGAAGKWLGGFFN